MKGLIYAGFFLFVTVSLHEVGHLIVARRLISESANIHLFPSFPFGDILGTVNIPTSVSYPVWKGTVVAISGPIIPAVLMLLIWIETDSPVMGIVSSFFAANQLAYSFVEPLLFLDKIPLWGLRIPIFAGAITTFIYALYVRSSDRIEKEIDYDRKPDRT